MKVIFSLVLMLSLLACSSQTMREQAGGNKAAEINVHMGITYMNKGYYDIALIKLQRALKQDDGLAVAHNAIATLYGLLNNAEKATYHFEQALSLQANYPEAHNNYGRFLCRQGQLKRADKQFQLAIASPRYISAHKAYLNAAICVLKDKDYVKAQDYFNKALTLRPKWARVLFEMALLQYETGENIRARAYLLRHAMVSQPIPDALWLGVLIEHKLSNQTAMMSYQRRLQALFPRSKQAEKSRRRVFE